MKARLGKKISAILVIGMLTFTLGAVGCSSVNNEEVIRQTISEEFDIYKNLDDEAMSKVAEAAENEGLTELGINEEELATAVLEGFDYSINEVKVNGNEAVANVTIISKSMSDFETKFNDAVQNLMSEAAAGTVNSDEVTTKVGELAMQAFDDAEIISENADLQFELQGNTWVSTNVSEVLGDLDSMVFAA